MKKNNLYKKVAIMGMFLMCTMLGACGKKEVEEPTTTQVPTAEVVIKENVVLVPGVITVGISPNVTPYIDMDEKGRISGFEIDLMNLIGDATFHRVDFVMMEEPYRYMDLDNNKFDCIISAVALDEAVDKVYDFSVPYLTYVAEDGTTTDYAILVKSGNNRLLNVLNLTIKKIREDDRYTELNNKWFNKGDITESNEDN